MTILELCYVGEKVVIRNFEKLFCATFSRSKNAKFLEKLAVRLARSEWARLLDMIEGAARKQSAAQQRRRGRDCNACRCRRWSENPSRRPLDRAAATSLSLPRRLSRTARAPDP